MKTLQYNVSEHVAHFWFSVTSKVNPRRKCDKIVFLLPTLMEYQNLKSGYIRKSIQGFPGGAVVENPPADAGDMVRALVREDPTCRGATKPACHNY